MVIIGTFDRGYLGDTHGDFEKNVRHAFSDNDFDIGMSIIFIVKYGEKRRLHPPVCLRSRL